MITTVTFNPSLDRTLEVPALVRGGLTRGTSTRVDPGGKGVNVARALAEHGQKTCAVLPVGGPDGDRLLRLLAADGIEVCAVPVRAATRSNISLVEPDGTVTKVNEPGGALCEEDVSALIATVLLAAEGAQWAVLCGSLPPGVPLDVYDGLCDALGATGTRVAVDTSGPALHAALAARPTLVKPNREELAEAVGRELRTLGDALSAAHQLRAQGAGSVLASLGVDGALLVDGEGATYGCSSVAAPRSSVGAGDAMLAGFLAAGGQGRDALRAALAWGAAAVRLPGSRMPAASDLRLHDVQMSARIDVTQHLTQP